MRINIVATKMTGAHITGSPTVCFAVNCRCHYINKQINTWQCKIYNFSTSFKKYIHFYKAPKHIILGTSHIT